jgi:hypothetical protein
MTVPDWQHWHVAGRRVATTNVGAAEHARKSEEIEYSYRSKRLREWGRLYPKYLQRCAH